MDSDADDPINLFEEDEDNPERIAENLKNTEKSESGTRVAPPKRVVKNPRLKFNPERLCGNRGIPVLLDHFKKVKFKGKGYEVEDLDKLMATLEHWSHRLFPSMNFQDCLSQIEKLGKKRQVQTTLRKIRLDMPILDNDFVKDDEEDIVLRNDDPDPMPIPSEDPFDRLIADSQDVLPSTFLAPESVHDTFMQSPAPNVSRGQVLGSSFGSSLTEEQKERMARNKMLAAERRKAKLAALNTSDSEINHASSASQGHSSAFESLNANEISSATHLSRAFDDMFEQADATETSLDKENSTQNADELELEDLMDLVENDEPNKANDISGAVKKSAKIQTNVESDRSFQSSSSAVKEIKSVIYENKNYSETFDDIFKPPDATMREVVETNNTSLDKEKDNQNSDELAIDDLVDLVEDDESSKNNISSSIEICMEEKTTVKFSQSLECSLSASKSIGPTDIENNSCTTHVSKPLNDIFEPSTVTTKEVTETSDISLDNETNSKNVDELGFDDLMDLVEGDEAESNKDVDNSCILDSVE